MIGLCDKLVTMGEKARHIARDERDLKKTLVSRFCSGNFLVSGFRRRDFSCKKGGKPVL